jgi:hypothetical protein
MWDSATDEVVEQGRGMSEPVISATLGAPRARLLDPNDRTCLPRMGDSGSGLKPTSPRRERAAPGSHVFLLRGQKKQVATTNVGNRNVTIGRHCNALAIAADVVHAPPKASGSLFPRRAEGSTDLHRKPKVGLA